MRLSFLFLLSSIIKEKMCKVAVCHWTAVKLKLEIYYIKLFIRNQIALTYLYDRLSTFHKQLKEEEEVKEIRSFLLPKWHVLFNLRNTAFQNNLNTYSDALETISGYPLREDINNIQGNTQHTENLLMLLLIQK